MSESQISNEKRGGDECHHVKNQQVPPPNYDENHEQDQVRAKCLEQPSRMPQSLGAYRRRKTSRVPTVCGSPVVKVRAIKDFKINNYDEDQSIFVPFNADQEFFVLMADPKKMLYFVTTNLSAPFSKGSLCGLAEMDKFIIVTD